MVLPPGLSPLAGRFIAFEGGDGAGKSTHLKLLADELRRRGLVDTPGQPGVVVTREPGGTTLGCQIRQILLHGGDLAATAEALLYAADRAQHVAELIGPALSRGDLVLTDRYLDSSISYQVEGRGLSETTVRQVNALATAGLRPDLTILLDVGQATAWDRLSQSGQPADRLERAGEDFHRRVNQRYRDLAAADPDRYAIIASEAPLDEVQERLWQAFERYLDAWTRQTRAGRP
ncbi:MAG: dTMP kinase [Bifidobacteriaceae bacterium]|jgi:dTMP kinase|nr:dTMP kinase [Bifidobacteriaceae bacterium]